MWPRSWGSQNEPSAAGRGNWKRLLREQEVGEARRLADQSLEATVAQRGRNRKIVEMALLRLAKAVADGKVRMQLSDIERLIRLQADLDRPGVPGLTGSTPEEILAAFFGWFQTLDEETRQRTIAQAERLESGLPSLPPPA